MIRSPDVVRNLDRIRDRITAAGGDPDTVAVLAVTKGFGPDAVDAAVGAGLVDVGENYAREMHDKATAVAGRPRWHFIGRLQSNKVRTVADLVDVWQSLDRPTVIDEVARRRPGATAFVQVNATGEAQKGGCAPDDTAELVGRARDAGLDVQGLMAVGVAGDDVATAGAFTAVARLADHLDLPQRSMGMTGDLEVAVRAGTTMIRVGTALFGPRSPRDEP